jgi:hypothetical protein
MVSLRPVGILASELRDVLFVVMRVRRPFEDGVGIKED